MRRGILALALGAQLSSGRVEAAGNLKPRGSHHADIEIRDHHVAVVINNGFAATEVTQTFFNPNAEDLEAIYSFPLPRSASLSEFEVFLGETAIQGEVLERAEATRIYEEERDQGNDAGLASKNGCQTFQFQVSPVRAGSETRVRFLYYQPLEIDAGVGRYLYPLEEGGTDDAGASFWLRNPKVEGKLSVTLELKSAWPIASVRVPGFEPDVEVLKKEGNHYQVTLEREGASLDRDFLFYYRLEEGLPGRVEVVPYRASENEPGTFMMVVTPGIDLAPIRGGSDFSFVLDVSGSMAGKIATLAAGVLRGLAELEPEDRFRVVAFNDRGHSVTEGFLPATAENVESAEGAVRALSAAGSTNLYEGLALGLDGLDSERATTVVLITDAVANTGVIDPVRFHELLRQHDVRLSSFLVGNSGNWPLMRTMSEASGGFVAPVSNADDVLGQVLLAKSKLTHEALHDVRLQVRGGGVRVFDTTADRIDKVYRGQQLVLFGKYEGAGPSTLTLTAGLTGEDRTYRTDFEFPATATENPEIERLWALDRIERVEVRRDSGLLDPDQARDTIVNLGTEYQLVTDFTSMVVLADEKFEGRGIARRNRARTQIERQAAATRATAPARDYRVDSTAPAFPAPAPTVGGSQGGGGGALDPVSALVALGLAALARRAGRMKR
jgi:Ca-activated chloride channel family protein